MINRSSSPRTGRPSEWCRKANAGRPSEWRN